MQAAEEAVQVQSHKLREVMQEKTDLEARLQHSSHQLAALQAAADAAGHQKDAELQHLAAQLKVAALTNLVANNRQKAFLPSMSCSLMCCMVAS